MSKPARRSASLVVILAALSLLIGACDGTSNDETGGAAAGGDGEERRTVVASLATEVITPLVLQANTALGAARDAAAAYCATPSPETRQAALAAVDAGITAYERLDPVDMGPIGDRRTDSHVVYPVDGERVEALLVDSPATDPESIESRTPSSARGLTAAEYLLSAVPSPDADPMRCVFLVAITTDAARSMSLVIADSFGGPTGVSYYARMSGPDATAENLKGTIDVVVNMALTVLDVDAGLLADPGDQSQASVRREVAAHLATIAAVWGDGATGVSQLVDGELARRVADEVTAAAGAVGDADSPAAEAQAAVEEVRATLGTEVVSALDVVIGFSDNDGDS